MVIPAWVIVKIEALPEGFTGSIEINVYLGGVSNVTVRQSFVEPGYRSRKSEMVKERMTTS